MADSMLLLHTGITIAGIVVIITWLRVPPIIALLAGSLYFGLVTGLGLDDTTKVVAEGFGELMTEIGLLITFGVLLGSMLTATSTMQRVTEAITRRVPPRGVPYVFSATLSSLFTSIYSDVLLVLTAPLARRLAPKLGPQGLALMGGALTAGIEVGLVFVVPGVAAVAVAGLLHVPLGTMFVLGLVVALPTALLTMLVFSWLSRGALRWNAELDELAAAETADDDRVRASAVPAAGSGESGEATGEPERTPPPLALCVAPVVLTLLLISAGALAEAFGWTPAVVGFVGDPVIAMFLGATAAYAVARRHLPGTEVGAAVSSALTTAGPILVLTGVSGSLAAVIGESGLEDVLAGYFSVGFLPPLLLVWLVAAILHIALGSISVAAITAAGLLAPLAGGLGVEPVLIALAAGSGALFVPHVSSNFFWMFQSLLGFTTRGTLKTHSVAMTLSSVLSLPLILLLDVVV
ncbi:GntP family permease [Prauserella flavalba]|uniref:GntP family permease n=1 Tax=Prauserella flavalba TaxID=1477506 RepID=UPI0036EDEEDB